MKPERKEIYDIFLSYSPGDRDWVEKFRTNLMDQGIQVFDASRDIQPGQDWTAVLEEALSQSRYMIIVLTPNSLSSNWVNFELGAAVSMQKSLIPIVSKELTDSDLPFPVRRWIHLSMEDNAEETAEKVRAAVTPQESRQ
jgi:hypothetical protein